jgi:hypothetical protein
LAWSQRSPQPPADISVSHAHMQNDAAGTQTASMQIPPGQEF